jgi:thiol-disulfide isomerase/thioredoxin
MRTRLSALTTWGAALAVVLATSLASAAPAGIIPDVRAAVAQGDFAKGEALIAAYRQEHGTTPEALEALSWLARGALAKHNLDKAEDYAAQTYGLCTAALKTRQMDAEPHLPIAIGAAIEVQAQAMAERGQRSGAVAFLEQQLAAYKPTSIRMRIQKNINLLTLEGKPAVALTAAEHLGPQTPSLKGHPAVLFFWAHWCPDCKHMAPALGELEAAYRDKGLIVVGPTQYYGYTTRGESATPAQELAYIDSVRKQYYGMIANMSAPVSNDDFNAYGVSTTPTVVVVNREGIVTLYHPGQMTRAELEPYIQAVVAPQGLQSASR